ncbi:hypothetical protein KKA95_04780, partial [Patescibacteria group bacterium]|nr:hypothetical protein [Patescibacteria group bacterium]
MRNKPKSNGMIKAAAIGFLLTGLGIGGLQCAKEVPMDDGNPNSPRMTWIAKKRMDLSRCLLDKETWSGIGECFNPFESSDEEKEDDAIAPEEEAPKEDKKPERKRSTPKFR